MTIISSETNTAARFAEMDRLGHGSIRLECPDQWVALVHFSSRDEISSYGPIKHRYCDFSLHIGDRVFRATRRGSVEYADFQAWIAHYVSIADN